MIRKMPLIAAVVLGAASFATADTGVVFVNGHNPATITRTEVRAPSQAPYSLTGSERTLKENLTRNIWVGSRFVGAMVVQR